MRALAVTNPNATAMTARARDAVIGVIRALGSDVKLDVEETTGPGDAAELAARARIDGVDVVFAVGGDGTVNEIVNGLLRDGPAPGIPRLAVVSGGNANVFARALGLPARPAEAATVTLDRLRAGRARSIGLGRLTCDGPPRWFTFCAGFGLDAEIVRTVDTHRRLGARATPGLFARSALAQLLRTDRRRPAITLSWPAEGDMATSGPLFMAVITNTTPWTYFGDRPLQPTPQASFDTGLDAFGLRRLGIAGTAAILCRLLAGSAPRGRRTLVRHDEAQLTVRCGRPVAVQVDGEYLGERSTGHLEAVPNALSVVC